MFFKVIGICGILAGAVIAYLALQMEVAVDVDGHGYVANLQLLETRLANIVLGVGIFLGGAIFLISGAVLDSMREQADRLLRNEAPPPEPEIYA